MDRYVSYIYGGLSDKQIEDIKGRGKDRFKIDPSQAEIDNGDCLRGRFHFEDVEVDEEEDIIETTLERVQSANEGFEISPSYRIVIELDMDMTFVEDTINGEDLAEVFNLDDLAWYMCERLLRTYTPYVGVEFISLDPLDFTLYYGDHKYWL